MLAKAAITGNKKLALEALVAHPLVRDYDVAKPLLEEMLEAHKEYLPQFYHHGK